MNQFRVSNNKTKKEVNRMKELRGWPFEPLEGSEANPLGGPGAGPGNPG